MKQPDLNAVRERIDQVRKRNEQRVLGVVLRGHKALYLETNGAIGSSLFGSPCLLLTATGRVTGKPRTVALMYATDGEDLVVVGSNGGADQPPEWLENIRANGHVALQVKRERFAATADVVDQNDRRYERLWRLVNTAAHGRYYHYQQATTRPIPVVVLSRANEDA